MGFNDMRKLSKDKNVNTDFISQKLRLNSLLYNETLLKKVNDDSRLKIILPLFFLFNYYYDGTITLLCGGKYSSIYSVARSAMECFANFSKLCNNFNSPLFFEVYKTFIKKDILQISKIADAEEIAEEKDFLIKTIVSKLRELGIDISENDNAQISHNIDAIKNYLRNNREYQTTTLVLNSLDSLENVYGNNTKFTKTLYGDLCRLSHNNISGIAERLYKKEGDKITFCGDHYTSELIKPIQELFVVCGKYIEKWLKDNVLIDIK